MKLDLKILNAKILVTINKFNFNFDFIIIKIIIQFKMFKLLKSVSNGHSKRLITLK